MTRRGLTIGRVALVLLGLGSASRAVAADPASRLLSALRAELGLVRSSTELREGLDALGRERASLEYTAAVLDHAGTESMRRLSAYRRVRGERETRARARARALYKLARGGAARVAFAPGRAGAERLRVGWALRFLVRNDVQTLAVHRRAERRAASELLAATRELQAMAAVTTLEAMTDHVLGVATNAVDPALARAHRERRRAQTIAGGNRERAGREIAHEIAAARAERRDSSSRMAAPVPGRIVGRFGRYKDRVLRVELVRNGVELRARVDQVVAAAGSGRVAYVSSLPGFEQVVVIDHGDGRYSLTARLWKVGVSEGDTISRGDALGRVAPKLADDGLGPTVYFELRTGERPVDPAPYLHRD